MFNLQRAVLKKVRLGIVLYLKCTKGVGGHGGLDATKNLLLLPITQVLVSPSPYKRQMLKFIQLLRIGTLRAMEEQKSFPDPRFTFGVVQANQFLPLNLQVLELLWELVGVTSKDLAMLPLHMISLRR